MLHKPVFGLSLFCSTRLHLFDQKYSKNCEILLQIAIFYLNIYLKRNWFLWSKLDCSLQNNRWTDADRHNVHSAICNNPSPSNLPWWIRVIINNHSKRNVPEWVGVFMTECVCVCVLSPISRWDTNYRRVELSTTHTRPSSAAMCTRVCN